MISSDAEDTRWGKARPRTIRRSRDSHRSRARRVVQVQLRTGRRSRRPTACHIPLHPPLATGHPPPRQHRQRTDAPRTAACTPHNREQSSPVAATPSGPLNVPLSPPPNSQPSLPYSSRTPSTPCACERKSPPPVAASDRVPTTPTTSPPPPCILHTCQHRQIRNAQRTDASTTAAWIPHPRPLATVARVPVQLEGDLQAIPTETPPGLTSQRGTSKRPPELTVRRRNQRPAAYESPRRKDGGRTWSRREW